MDKYYTPEISEFHVDFVWEEKLTEHDSWINCVGDWDLLNSVYDDWEHDNENFSKLYRVKYLDKADIESLGWLLNPYVGNEDNVFDFENYSLYFDSLIKKEKLGIGITIYNVLSNIIFQGYIKNKSELQKLMQQLSIK